jgi:uncharacterized protein (TIGR03435 family)
VYPIASVSSRSKRFFPYIFFCTLTLLIAKGATAQATFDVASIRPSSTEIKFERNGTTEVAHGTLNMRAVSIDSCIHWAYGTPTALIHGPALLREAHYDITAKAPPDTTEEQMRLMLRALLTERFKLAFHNEKAELRVYTLTVAKSGIKMHPSVPGSQMSHQNSNAGMVGKAMTMGELADYLADPLGAPLIDNTGLPGRYDFTIDFTPYIDPGSMNNGDRPDPVVILKAALKGELGLEMVQSKETVDTFVVDHVDPPTAN